MMSWRKYTGIGRKRPLRYKVDMPVLMLFSEFMTFIADLHIHSHFSRATSKTLDPEHLTYWARRKGIMVIGTGDFTHPGWVSELQDKVTEAEGGLYRLKPELQQAIDETLPPSCPGPTRFLLTGEISCIYKKNGKTRKVHHLILMPDFDAVSRFNQRLDRIGNITSDGRPILGLDSRDLLEITLEASDRAFFIPAHIWTPWFSVFGSKSGFDTLEECFEDLTGHIHALETGLSSDPSMNRCLSALDPYLLVSNSDAHSPAKLGREANLFDTETTYEAMVRAMTTGRGFLGTIEFFPEEGKYHLDGHRKCRTRFHPRETKRHDGICPVCGKALTVGVLNRVYELSDRLDPRLSKAFFSLIPLPEVLSELLGCGPSSKKVAAHYDRLLSELGPELPLLMDMPLEKIEETGGPILAEAVHRMRQNRVRCDEGYDGEYGAIHLFDRDEIRTLTGQMALFPKDPASASKRAPGKRRSSAGPLFPPSKEKEPLPLAKTFKDPILDPLNPEQRSAVTFTGGHLLVVAGPGTGKTMTLTHRIAHLIREGQALPQQILALTFTRKAATEMEQRIKRLLNTRGEQTVTVLTFHGFCLDLLRKEAGKIGLPLDFHLCSETDGELVLREILTEKGKGPGTIRSLIRSIHRKKARPDPEEGKKPEGQDLDACLEEYKKRLRNMGMLDLDDLEGETLNVLRRDGASRERVRKRYPWVFVDEYQDTNPLQVDLLKMIIGVHPDSARRENESGGICAIGDPNQAIYGFRGADVGNFFRFHQDFQGAKEISLNRNYRSTEIILRGAAGLLKKPRPLRCESSGGPMIALATCRTEAEEAEMIIEQIERLMGGTTLFSLDSGRVGSHEGENALSFGDIGVLFRLNAQGDALQEAFERAGIPFIRSGERPLIQRYPVDILWRFFQACQYPEVDYYRKRYRALAPKGDLLPEKRFLSNGSPAALIDRVLKLHDLDLSTEPAMEALNRLRAVGAHYADDVKGFLDTITMERGLDHALYGIGDRVGLMSLHAAKGLEWPVVFIVGCEDRLIPCTLFARGDDAEERRLFYVGMTRAKIRLILSRAKRRNLQGRALDMGPTPFLRDIPGELCAPLERRGWKPRKKAHQQLALFS